MTQGFLPIGLFYMTVRWVIFHAAAKSLQSCPTLCDPIDSSPPDSPVLGILQARILEWVAISFSNELITIYLHCSTRHFLALETYMFRVTLHS